MIRNNQERLEGLKLEAGWIIEGSFGLENDITMRAYVIKKVPSRRSRCCWSFWASWWIGGSVDRWIGGSVRVGGRAYARAVVG